MPLRRRRWDQRYAGLSLRPCSDICIGVAIRAWSITLFQFFAFAVPTANAGAWPVPTVNGRVDRVEPAGREARQAQARCDARASIPGTVMTRGPGPRRATAVARVFR
jgi:hypothetical protein